MVNKLVFDQVKELEEWKSTTKKNNIQKCSQNRECEKEDSRIN